MALEASSSGSESDDESSEQGGSSEIQQIFVEISELINCLYRLSMSVHTSTGNHRYIKSAKIDTSYFQPTDIGYVRDKFPSAKGYLVDRLGKAISKRRQYLKYRELHQAKLAQHLDGLNDNATVLSETTATGLGSGANGRAILLEPDLEEESTMSETSYAVSTDHDGGQRMPSMPNEAKLGSPFECPYCHAIDCVKNTHDWMKHIYRDLQPYLCTFEDCASSSEMYESRRKWYGHELQHHRRWFSCNGHCERVFPSADLLVAHMKDTSSGKIVDTQVPMLIRMSTVPIDRSAESSCPLCLSVIAGSNQFRKHLGRHMEEIALFALPKSYAGSEDSTDPGSPDTDIEEMTEHIDEPRLDATERGRKHAPELADGNSPEEFCTHEQYHCDVIVSLTVATR